MATLMSTLVARARQTLLEPAQVTNGFWTDAELLAHGNSAVKDLWKGFIDLFQDHFVTFDITNMSIAANASSVTGVPADLFRVKTLKPRTLGTSSSNKGLVFQCRTLTHPDFVQAEAMGPISPRDSVVFYAVVNAGAPVGAPTIKLAPTLSSAVLLDVSYVPTLADVALGGTNPIPGESDTAITHWIIAMARAKEREDRGPDPEHLSIYATEKRNLLIVDVPRSEQDNDVVQGFWEPPAALVNFNG